MLALTKDHAAKRNYDVLGAAHMNPARSRISHVVFLNGSPVVVDEVAMAIARNPEAPEAVAYLDRVRALQNSYDPSQKVEGQRDALAITAAHTVRHVMNDPSSIDEVVRASEEGNLDALAVRQGMAAARMADLKANAWDLAKAVRSGDRDANLQAQGAYRQAIGGDKLAACFVTLFSAAFEEIPPPEAKVVADAKAEAAQEPTPAPPSLLAPEKDPLAGKSVGVTSAMDPDAAAVVWMRQQFDAASNPPAPAEVIPTRSDPLVANGGGNVGGVVEVVEKPVLRIVK